ncbi:MATE family efflux transporter [Eubacteriales bacterium OttesenSCG-928-K08]|nr:MATE family efflux transporter [Eubacteriales bacterium OttesenSCG-928-K08]
MESGGNTCSLFVFFRKERTNMQAPRTNKMETAPVSKLLLSISLPIMLSMMVQALYNVVDSIFIARYSEKALSAVSLTFPMQTLMIAVGIGTCIGVNAFLARTLGQKNMGKAKIIVQHGALLALFAYFIALLIGLFLTRQFFTLQTTDAEIVSYGIDYMSVCMVFSFSMFGQQLFEKLLQASGRSMFSMISQIIGAIVNIILDPILIYGLGGFPSLGAKGAAIATVIGQTMGFICAFFFHQRYNKELKLSFTGFKFDFAIVKEIYKIGLPAMIMQAIGSITNFLLNGVFLTFSTITTAAYGICARLQNFVFMPVYGLTSGMLPIMSYNYGAKQKERILSTRRYALLYMAVIVLVGTAIIQILPNQLLGLFGASDEMRQIGLPALRIISISFIFEGFCLISQTSFQSVGRNRTSLICSVTRQIVTLFPLAYILSLSGNINYVWVAFPVAYALNAILSLVLWKDVKKKNIDTLSSAEYY